MTMLEGITVPTYIASVQDFYPAEESMYDYYNLHPDDAYSQTIIQPTVHSTQQQFPHLF